MFDNVHVCLTKSELFKRGFISLFECPIMMYRLFVLHVLKYIIRVSDKQKGQNVVFVSKHLRNP